MAGVKARGIISVNQKRYHNDREVVPAKWVSARGGRGIMVAAYKDTRDMIFDSNGNPLPFSNI